MSQKTQLTESRIMIWDQIVDELNGTFLTVPPIAAATRLIAAIVLAGLVGFEREWRHKPAGLRTHILVSMAACLFIIVGQQLAQVPFGAEDALRVDPLRLIEAVTAGVAFLAAGIIFTSSGRCATSPRGPRSGCAGRSGWPAGPGRFRWRRWPVSPCWWC